MSVVAIVRRLLVDVQSHKARLAVVAAGVVALLVSRRASSAAMGRSLGWGTAPKHAIKRFDRLIGNERLVEELPRYYAAIAEALVLDASPVVLVDWTHLHGRAHALVAALAVDGRSVLLLAHVCDVNSLGNTSVQLRFLEQLRAVLPVGCRPIVVTDAGFHGDFFRAILRLGWDFVGRIRGTAHLQHGGSTLEKADLYKRATARARDFPDAKLYAHRSISCRLVLVRRPHSKRRSKPTSNKELLEYRKSARDPWLLATSCTDCSAEAVVQHYARRMQIEESFRDAKSARFGLAFSFGRSRSLKRLAVQLLLVALALAAALILGRQAEEQRAHLAFQANSTKDRRVLSVTRLGLELIHAAVAKLSSLAGEVRGLFRSRRPPIRGDP